jgi:hypothetical protein
MRHHFRTKKNQNPLYRNKGGRPIIEISNDINQYMETVSHVAANRYLIKSKKNARYREGTFKEAFNKYPLRRNLCFTSFKNKLSNVFKRPHRLSDLCDVCETGKVSRLFIVVSSNILHPLTYIH